MHEILTVSHLGTFTSSLLMDVLGTGGFLVLLVSALKNRRQKRKEAEAADLASQHERPLLPGEAVVCGIVERAEGAKTAVRVEVDQDGEETESSGTWYVTWKETNRRVIMEPFYLRLATGERIRVEPTAEVFLIEKLDGLIRVDLTKRIRYAELSPGERVYATGELAKAHDPEGNTPVGAYRSPRQGFVLRSPARGTMLLAAEPLGKRFHDRADFYTSSAQLIFLVALLFHGVFFGWHARRYHSQQTEATVTRLQHKMGTDSEGDPTHDYLVFFTLPNGVRLSDEVDSKSFAPLKEGDVLPARYVYGPFEGSTTLGEGNSVIFLAWLVVPLLFGTWAIYRSREKSTRPWYEREIVDTGGARLAESLAADKAREERRATAEERRRNEAGAG